MEGPVIRECKENDLDQLLYLYQQLHDNPIPKRTSELLKLWNQIIKDNYHHIIVAEEDGQIVSSCVCMIVLNLTHNQRPYALVENVVTDEQHRNKGLATKCLDYARELAQKEQCYKMMLMTGSKSENTLQFYEKAGYNRIDKTAFVQWL